MKVTPGSTDVTTYVSLVDSSDGSDATGLTIADLDLQYVRSGVAPVAKVDATALAATDSAHGDNQAIEIDATDQPGLYRVDWPDAAFAAGVREVILTVKHADCRAAHLRVELETLQTGDSFARVGATGSGLTSLASQASVDTIDANVDEILVDTGTTLNGKIDTIDTVVDAVKVQTDKFVFTVANQVDANIQSINDVAITGDGSGTPFNV